jgi:hypothetical protein
MKIKSEPIMIFLIIVLWFLPAYSEVQRIKIFDWTIIPDQTFINPPYWLVLYKVTSDSGLVQNEIDLYYAKDTLVTITGLVGRIEPYLFRWKQDSLCLSTYCKDINHDGKHEIVIGSSPNPGHVPETIYIYSIDLSDTTAPLIKVCDGAKDGYDQIWLKDLDGDSTYEIIAKSTRYRIWYGPSHSEGPRLVWKWDGREYRLANSKLANYINNIEYNIGDSTYDSVLRFYINSPLLSSNFRPDSTNTYPMILIDYMLFLTYTKGPSKAKYLLNVAWPSFAPGKGQFQKMFWNRVKSDPLWPELLKSNW